MVMHRRGRRLAVLTLAGLALAAVIVLAAAPPELTAADGHNITIDVDGRPVVSDVPPLIVEGRVMVPLRAVAESLGATVDWDGGTRRVAISSATAGSEVSPADFPAPASGFAGQSFLSAYNDQLTGLVASVSPSVVTVIVQTNDGSTVQGSGVIYDASGRILTNMHVVERPGEILVLLVDGRVFPASREAMDRLSDLAVLHIEAVNLTAIGFGDSSTLQAGELVVAVGSPITHRLATTVTMGIVSGIGRALTDTYYAYVQTDAALNPGNSGGPLVNMKGEVVGINTLKVEAPGVEGLSFALPANIAMKVAGDLDQLGRVRRPYLGADVQESWEAQIGLPTAAGLRVAGVVAGGPAAQAGIRAGDDMISLGGYPTGSLSQLLEAIERHAPGDSVLVEIQRAGQSLQIELTLGERPAD